MIHGFHLADHLTAFVVAFNHSLRRLWRRQQEEAWKTSANLRPMVVAGETLLIVSPGGAGLAVANLAG